MGCSTCLVVTCRVIAQSPSIQGALAVSWDVVPGVGMWVGPCLHGGCSLMGGKERTRSAVMPSIVK